MSKYKCGYDSSRYILCGNVPDGEPGVDFDLDDYLYDKLEAAMAEDGWCDEKDYLEAMGYYD